MRTWSFLIVSFALLASACGSGSSSPPPCVEGQACVPTSGANACSSYATTCDASTGAASCVQSGDLPDGTSCGSGEVCLASSCIAACVPGQPCTPTSAAAVCKTYATACADKLTVTTCEVGGNAADGTSCGSGLVCSSGSCVATCVPGVACTPSGTRDECKTYGTTCTSTLAQAVCAPLGNMPDGTTCNGTSVCQSGTCLGALAPPVISPTGGSGSPGLTVTITGPDPTAVVYYTTDGTAPSDDPALLSPNFTGSRTLTLQSTTIVQAFAKLDLRKSVTSMAVFTITQPPPVPASVNLGSGFTAGSVQTNGSASIIGTRLQLVPAMEYQVGSAFFPVAINVQRFTTEFSFQITDAIADGITFTIQGVGPYAMGSQGGGLGFGPDPFDSQRILAIDRSVAVKFDLYDNQGEGWNSTGVFTNGSVPSVPAVDLGPSGIDLHAGRVLKVKITYDGTLLDLTITDPSFTPAKVFTTTFAVDIPGVVGDVTGWVGFTAATGLKTGTHEILNWTYSNTL